MDFCGKCGEKLKENAKFCSKCGNAVSNCISEPVQGSIGSTALSKKKGMNTTLLIIVVIVAVAVLIGVVGSMSFNYKTAVADFERAMNDCDGEAIFRSMTTDAMLDELEEQLDPDNYADGWYQSWILSQADEYAKDEYGEGIFKTVEDYYDELSEAAESMKAYLNQEYGGNVVYSIEIQDAREMTSARMNHVVGYYLARNATIAIEDIREGYTLDVIFLADGKKKSASYATEMDVVYVQGDGWMISEEFFYELFSDEALSTFTVK